MSNTGGDGLVRRGANDDNSGLSDSKIESARRFLYDEDSSFGSHGDNYPVSITSDRNSGTRRTTGNLRTNLSGMEVSRNQNKTSRTFNTAVYHGNDIKNRGRKIMLITAVALTLVGCIVLLKRDHSSEVPPKKHLHGPRLQQFQSTIVEMGLTSREDLENPETSQYHALQWIANSDKSKLKPDDPFALDRYALAVLFYETSLMNNKTEVSSSGQWIESSNWLSNMGVCSWHGIVCEGDDPNLESEGDQKHRNHHGFVQTLKLPSNDLKGSLPSELSALTALYELDLSHNTLIGTLPKSFGSLSGLRTLVLRDNQLTGNIPIDYGHDLKNLRQLILAENKLQGQIPSQMEHMVELRVLDIGKNLLTGAFPGLEDLTKLRELVLEDNQLEGKFPESLSKLTSLVVLDLSKNHFTGVMPEELQTLIRLEKLLLRDMNLMGTIPHNIFNKVTRLTELGLSDNSFTGQIPTSIGHLKDLHKFFMGNNKFDGTIPRQIGLLADLSLLELQGNKIKGTIPNLIAALNSLEHLTFARNQLTGTIPVEVGNLHRLKSLFLEDNKFTGDIPPEIGNIQTLQQARLYENNFEGSMPQEVCDLITDEDLVYLGADCVTKIECKCCTKCF